MKLILKLFALFSLLATLNACNTLSGTAKSKGSGRVKTYDKPYNQVWNKTLKAVEFSSLKIVSQDKNKGEILASNGAGLMSFGERVAIFVEKEKNQPNETRVEIISKKVFEGNFLAPNWEEKLFNILSQELSR